MLTLCLISDTHGCHHQLTDLPVADILVHAGDWTAHSSYYDVRDFLIWFVKQPHRKKVIIAGNHETWVEANPRLLEALLAEYAPGVHYLNDSGVTIEGLRIWGSPISPAFMNWAFNRARGPEIQAHWDLIPDDTQLLVTHGPVAGIHDGVPDNLFDPHSRVEHVGCRNLDATIRNRLKQLRAHVCGHVHLHGGKKETWDGIVYVNASLVDESYTLKHEPVLIGL